MNRRGYPHCTIPNNTMEEMPKLIFSSLLRRTIRFLHSKTTSFSTSSISIHINI